MNTSLLTSTNRWISIFWLCNYYFLRLISFQLNSSSFLIFFAIGLYFLPRLRVNPAFLLYTHTPTQMSHSLRVAGLSLSDKCQPLASWTDVNSCLVLFLQSVALLRAEMESISAWLAVRETGGQGNLCGRHRLLSLPASQASFASFASNKCVPAQQAPPSVLGDTQTSLQLKWNPVQVPRRYA